MSVHKKKKKKKKDTYYDPCLISCDYDDQPPEQDADGENEMEESLSSQIYEIIRKRRDYYRERETGETRVVFTSNAPEELQAMSGDGTAWLVPSKEKLTVRFDDENELYEVEPDWILIWNVA